MNKNTFNPEEWSPSSKGIRRIADSVLEQIEELMLDQLEMVDEPNQEDEEKWDAWYEGRYEFFLTLLLKNLKGDSPS